MCSNQRWEDKFGTKQRGLWTEEGTREAGPQRGEEECSVFSGFRVLVRLSVGHWAKAVKL